MVRWTVERYWVPTTVVEALVSYYSVTRLYCRVQQLSGASHCCSGGWVASAPRDLRRVGLSSDQ